MGKITLKIEDEGFTSKHYSAPQCIITYEYPEGITDLRDIEEVFNLWLHAIGFTYAEVSVCRKGEPKLE
jgi:hypothetical protein